MVYTIEISNEECVFLHYALNLMDHAINSIPSDVDSNKIGLKDASEALGLVLSVRDKTIEDAVGNDKNKALTLLNSLHKKVTNVMNT